MPKPYHVTNLMNNDAKFITILANRYSLAPIPLSANERAAAANKESR
jgi:hypothetical protein